MSQNEPQQPGDSTLNPRREDDRRVEREKIGDSRPHGRGFEREMDYDFHAEDAYESDEDWPEDDEDSMIEPGSTSEYYDDFESEE